VALLVDQFEEFDTPGIGAGLELYCYPPDLVELLARGELKRFLCNPSPAACSWELDVSGLLSATAGGSVCGSRSKPLASGGIMPCYGPIGCVR